MFYLYVRKIHNAIYICVAYKIHMSDETKNCLLMECNENDYYLIERGFIDVKVGQLTTFLVCC